MKKLLFICILVVSVLISCKTEKAQEKKEAVRPVKCASVSASGGIYFRSFNGTTRSGSETNLSFRTNGLINQIRVKIGDRVRKAQLLAEIDKKDILLGLEQAKASLQGAKIQLETNKSNLERVKELYQTNSVALKDYEQAKNAYAAAKSSYQTALKAKDLKESQLEYAQIVAPTNGIVTQVNAEVNEFAQAGSPIVVMNSGGGDLEVNVGVPEAYISMLRNGSKVEVSISSEKVSGMVTEVGFSTGSRLATYPVIIKLLDASQNIRPGMPANVKFQFGDANSNKQLSIPVKAVGEDQNGNYVYKLVFVEGNTYKVEKTSVEIGALGDNGFELLSGLTEGELVATAGLRSLYSGQLVSILK